MKKTAQKKSAQKKSARKASGSGDVVAACFLSLGAAALGIALGYAVGSEKKETKRKLHKLDRRTAALKEMVEEVEEKSRKLQVVTPEGTFPLFDQSWDIES